MKKGPRNIVTRLGDLLHFGQLFKDCGNNYFAKSSTFQVIFVQLSKYFIFLVKSFLDNFFRHLAIFSGHTVQEMSFKISDVPLTRSSSMRFTAFRVQWWKPKKTQNSLQQTIAVEPEEKGGALPVVKAERQVCWRRLYKLQNESQ